MRRLIALAIAVLALAAVPNATAKKLPPPSGCGDSPIFVCL
jgi:hypothetical protein